MMKKLMIMSCMLCLTVAAMADGGKIDGSTVKKITFNGNQVTIEYNNGTQTTTDMAEVIIDFSMATNIEERTAIVKEAGLLDKKMYDLKGQEVVNGSWLMVHGQLKKGVYIVDGKKVVVKSKK
jgi:hypothetical protein